MYRENRNLIFGLIIIGLMWLVLTKNMTWWLDLSTIVYKIGLGVGAVLGGLSTIPIIRDWRRDREMRQYKEKNMKKFSYLKRDKKRIAIWKSEADPIYAIDKVSNTRQHIMPWSTFKELGYPDDGWDKTATQKELETYTEIEPIDFSKLLN